MFWLLRRLVPASARGAAATAAALAALITAAEAVDYTPENSEYNHGADDDGDDDRPPSTQLILRILLS